MKLTHKAGEFDSHPVVPQAGGWKSPRMPLHYAEKINVARSGMAKAAAASGRDTRGDQPGEGAER